MNAPQITNHFMPRINGYIKRAEQLKKVLATSAPSPSEEKTEEKEEEEEEEDEEDFDLDEELKKLVGMKNIKREILAMRREMMLDKRRIDLGLEIEKAQAPHIAFYGNPGTGKTRIARLIGKIFKQLEVIPKGKLVEVQRSDLVAGYIGQTATKTRKVIEKSKGGVLFVDEAYRLLGRSDDGKDFGPEAIEELMSEMTKGDPVMVFAGYKHDMERFFKSNAGLFRRVSRHFIFSDYTAKEISQITFLVVKKKGFKFSQGTTVDKLAQMIERNTTQLQRSAFNGAMASRIFDLAKRNLDRRLSLKASADELVTFSDDDVQKALKEIPHPPKGSIIPMPQGSEDVVDSSEDEDHITPMNNSGGGGGDGLRIPVAILNNNK